MEIIVIFAILAVIGLDIAYIKNYKFFRNLKYKMEIKHSDNIFNRDIDTTYSPSIVSYLYNQKIEPEKDLIADILNLYAKKIIDIVEENDKGFSIKMINNEYSLFENDEYIVDTIILKKTHFKYEEWIKKVIKVYREKVNVKEYKNKKNIDGNYGREYFERLKERKKKEERLTMLMIISLIPLGLILAILSAYFGIKVIIYFAYIVFFTIIAIPVFAIIKKSKTRDEKIDMYLTKEAKEELKKWMRLENFIKSYTLLGEKKFEEILLFEQYIPYAMVLNINKKYKEELIRVLGKDEVKSFISSANEYKMVNNILVQYSI